jgi:hypothetical protein
MDSLIKLDVFWRTASIALVPLCLVVVPGQAYDAHILHFYSNGSSAEITGAATSITSVLGEARPNSSSSGTPFTPNRFHQGVDIAAVNGINLSVDDIIFPINIGVSGAVGIVTDVCSPGMACSGTLGVNAYIKVQSISNPNQTFSYVHVDPSLNVSDIVYSTTVLGTALLTHLHLNQVENIGGTDYDVNPETNGLEFTDDEAIQFPSESLGNGVPGNMFFDEIPDSNSTAGISTAYLWRYADSDAYFATNEFLNGQALDQNDPDLRDPSRYPAGNYFACAAGEGLIDQTGAANIDAFCVPFILDRMNSFFTDFT